MSKRSNNYAAHAESARVLFLDYDQNAMINRFGLDCDSSYIYITFFGEKYAINRSTGEVSLNDVPASFEAVMSIYDILCYSKPTASLSGDWLAVQNLSPHSNFTSVDAIGKTTSKFTGKISQLNDTCTKLGGIPATTADVGFMFDAFPFLPIIFQFWDGDDEFPPRLVFLFDANTLDYIHFETAWYVAGFLSNLISENMPK